MGIYIAALILGAILPILIQKLFIYYNKFDDINHRSSHSTLATRTGGISVYLILFGVTIYQYVLREEIFDFSLLIPLSIMFIIGVYDDLYNADFKLKFLLQIIVAKILVDQGYVITNYYGLFGIYEISWLLAQLSSIFVFLIVVNAINFIDGIDGLAKTEVFKIIFIVELVSNNTTPLFNLAAIILASILPLYYFNFRKNHKVFLGDAGSLFLGSLVMLYIFHLLNPHFEFKQGYQINKVVVSVMILLYPLIDLLRVFIIRIGRGKSPFKADQNHLHHYIQRHLNSHHKTLFTIIFIEFLITSLVFIAFNFDAL